MVRGPALAAVLTVQRQRGRRSIQFHLTPRRLAAVRAELQNHSNRCTENRFLSTIENNERASYNGSIEASQASDVGSIPIARSIKPVDAVRSTGFGS
jgi:hypothetical protein